MDDGLSGSCCRLRQVLVAWTAARDGGKERRAGKPAQDRHADTRNDQPMMQRTHAHIVCTALSLLKIEAGPPWRARSAERALHPQVLAILQASPARAQPLLPVRFMQLLSISWPPSLPPAAGATV